MNHQHSSILRHFSLGLCIILASAASGAQQQNTADDAPGSIPCPLSSDWLYNGIHRPLMLTLSVSDDALAAHDGDQASGDQVPVHVVVLAHDGEVLVPAIGARVGRFDLAELMPEIWSLREAAYLQVMLDYEPYGAAMVLQPMLSRMVPITEQATRPGGATYTKIVGWRSAAEPDRSQTEDESANDTDEPPPPPRRVMSGLRVYPDRDILMQTSLGEMRFAMRPDAAPNTAWNFRHLCAGGFYRDVIFHRIVPLDREGLPFVVQAGDPSATGEGSAGYWLPIEPSDLPHDLGVISMARSDDPDSAGTQFFICLSREGTARLDMQYCAFGELLDGAETLRAIAAVELADVRRGRPANPPVIEYTTLVPASPRAPGIGRLDTRIATPAAPEQPERPGRVDR